MTFGLLARGDVSAIQSSSIKSRALPPPPLPLGPGLLLLAAAVAVVAAAADSAFLLGIIFLFVWPKYSSPALRGLSKSPLSYSLAFFSYLSVPLYDAGGSGGRETPVAAERRGKGPSTNVTIVTHTSRQPRTTTPPKMREPHASLQLFRRY